MNRGFDSFYGYLNGAVDYYNKTIEAGTGEALKAKLRGEPIEGYDWRYETSDGNGGVNDMVIHTKEYSMDLYKEHLQHVIGRNLPNQGS